MTAGSCEGGWSQQSFSCKTRYFCPTCYQKRVLLYGEWVEEHVLEPVPHRQYVFAVPRLSRPVFARRRVAGRGTRTVESWVSPDDTMNPANSRKVR